MSLTNRRTLISHKSDWIYLDQRFYYSNLPLRPTWTKKLCFVYLNLKSPFKRIQDILMTYLTVPLLVATIKGYLYRRINVRKFSFTAMSRINVKRDFRTYIRRYTSPSENFQYGYPNSNAFLQSRLKLEPCKPHKAAQKPMPSNEMWRNWWRQTISDSISQDILSTSFDVIQSDVTLQKQVH